MSSTFEIFEGQEGGWFFRLKSSDGEQILASQPYSTKADAEQGVASVRVNASVHAHYDRRQTPTGFWFVINSATHRIIGRSATYPTAAARDAGMLLVKTDAVGATVDDQA